MNIQHIAFPTPSESLVSLLDDAAPRPSGHVGATIDGDDPVLKTPFRIAAAGSAAIAAAACAAAEFWLQRGGEAQTVRVEARRAAAAMRSASYLRINGARPPPLWDKLSGLYPVRDGRFVSIHCNFPAHGEAAARVLGAPADRGAMETAALGWDGQALEDAIHVGGGCAGFVRTALEWRAHPQSVAVAAQKLIEIERIGDAPAEPPSPAARPLSGIRVLDLTRVLAGPTCARALAEHGADVLKVNAPHLPHSGAVELDTGMGKLASHLDLGTDEDAETLRRLAVDCDVFSQSYRPGALAKRGFSPERLAEIRPGVVCVTLTAWGPTGPWAARRGFDSIVQCVSGMADAQGGATPKLLPVSAIDYVSGYLMAFGAMVALRRRGTEGGSWHVRVGLARVGKWIVDHGLARQETMAGAADELTARELDRFCAEMESPSGRLRYLAPVAEMSATPPGLDRPGVTPGAHAPLWPGPRDGTQRAILALKLERGTRHRRKQSMTMADLRASKVPEVTLVFWIIKIAATTLGETGGDAVTMSLHLGYFVGTAIFATIFAVAVSAQIRATSFHPALYWLVIVATTTVGTTLADFADRSLGIGYAGGATILALLLAATLGAWRAACGSVAVADIASRKAEFFYWGTILFSQTLGTALGDWMADDTGLGYGGGAVVFAAALGIVTLCHLLTRVSRVALFWAAFILTRPLGATVGDFLDKPVADGGLAMSRFYASCLIAAFMIICIVCLPQRVGAEPGNRTREA